MAFKMKNLSTMKMAKKAGSPMDMGAKPMKMKKGSPMDKALIGDQNNLPPELKAKIEAAPESPKKMKKAAMKMKKTPMKQNTL